jgi:hypothetical protein
MKVATRQTKTDRDDVPKIAVVPADGNLLTGIIELARSYPYAHSFFGQPNADFYVRKLAGPDSQTGEGWYAVIRFHKVTAAAHLKIYGEGSQNGHTLWKIRHPLVKDYSQPLYLDFLFNGLIAVATGVRKGTAKFVIFLGEHEKNLMLKLEDVGFEREACLRDYYRLGEKCFIYGRTVA